MKYLLLLFISFQAYSVCITETISQGDKLSLLSQKYSVFVDVGEGIFRPLNEVKIKEDNFYRVQLNLITSNIKSFKSYDDKFLKYYTFERISTYLNEIKVDLRSLGYSVRKIGRSLEGRDLFSIEPMNLDPNKKTIVMFGRHHGDEGTANWIIEGFLNEYIVNSSLNQKFQLIVYPFINPDGAVAKSRYNSKGRDLNRSWLDNPKNSYDEVKIIYASLKKYMDLISPNILLIADMHGSISEDFIYRVNKNYVSLKFDNSQQNFINSLSIFDPWQNGNFKTSNGHPNMARIRLIDIYKSNVLTHETVKNILIRNSKGRKLSDLYLQGKAIGEAILRSFN